MNSISFPKLNFSLQVARQVLVENISSGANIMCSPFSITAILNLLAAGATGSTLDELLRLLECQSLSDVNTATAQMMSAATVSGGDNSGADRSVISFVNGVWINQLFSFVPSYQELAKTLYKADARVLDFQNKADEAVEEVNLWAEKATQGLIREVLKRTSVRKDIQLILANALYFKASWANAFDASLTCDGDFHLLSDCTIRAPFMNQTSAYYDYGSFDGCKVIRLPYKFDNFSMYIFLPDEKDGLPRLLESCKPRLTSLFEDELKLKNLKISTLAIPKFKFSSDCELSAIMRDLGLRRPFMNDDELTGMIVEGNFGVTSIIHKAYIETSEEGTEAACVTTMMLGCAPSKEPNIDFVGDHPFMFIIREDASGLVFFIGAVLNPLTQ